MNVSTYNPSRPHGFGLLNPDTVVPYQKNPILSAFFREIDRADELGSGMRKMMLYGKKYGGADPQLIEGDNFRMIISVPEFGENPAVVPVIKSHKQGAPHVGEQVGAGLSKADQLGTDAVPSLSQVCPKSIPLDTARKVLDAAASSAGLQVLMERAGQTNKTRFRNAVLKPFIAAGLIEMTIPDKPRSSKQLYRLTAKGRALLEDRTA